MRLPVVGEGQAPGLTSATLAFGFEMLLKAVGLRPSAVAPRAFLLVFFSPVLSDLTFQVQSGCAVGAA